MNSFNDYMEDLLNLKGLEITGEAREILKADMTQKLMNQIDHAALNELTEEQATVLSDKLDDPNFSDADAAAYMAECGVDMQRITLETMVLFKALFLGGGLAENSIEESEKDAENLIAAAQAGSSDEQAPVAAETVAAE